jgi:hypothetical protein
LELHNLHVEFFQLFLQLSFLHLVVVIIFAEIFLVFEYVFKFFAQVFNVFTHFSDLKAELVILSPFFFNFSPQFVALCFQHRYHLIFHFDLSTPHFFVSCFEGLSFDSGLFLFSQVLGLDELFLKFEVTVQLSLCVPFGILVEKRGDRFEFCALLSTAFFRVLADN